MTTPSEYATQNKKGIFDNPLGWMRLAQAMVIEAAKAAAAGSQEAAEWLSSQETGDLWLHLAGLDRRAVMSWVRAGCRASKDAFMHKGSGHYG